MFVKKKYSIRQQLRQLKYRYKGIQHVHFLHIGKTGGTAFREAVHKNLLTENYKIHLHGHGHKLRDVPAGEKVIFFLRDPISRYVSGFNSRYRNGIHHTNDWRPNEKLSFEKFQTPKELASALSSTDEEMLATAQYAMQNIGHVKSAYWDWFESESYFNSRLADVLYIGFQESLGQDFETIKQKLSLPEHIQLPVDPIRANRSDKGKANAELTEIERESLKDWYANDYDFFALCRKLVQSGHFQKTEQSR